jgi:hypothetical protein
MDKELDTWLCETLSIPVRELYPNDLHNIMLYYFPNLEICSDPELIKTTGCAYIKMDKNDPDERAILISNPTEARISAITLYLAITIALSVKNKEKQINVCRIL